VDSNHPVVDILRIPARGSRIRAADLVAEGSRRSIHWAAVEDVMRTEVGVALSCFRNSCPSVC